MHKWIRSHLTYANVMSTLAVFLVIGGGTALASYVVSSNSQVGPDTISGHHHRHRRCGEPKRQRRKPHRS
jgi:uncharacterized membrane protein